MRQPTAGSTPVAASLAPILAVALLSAVALSGCAGAPMGPGGPFGGRGEGRPAPRALFISPFGEPFAAPPGQAWPVADWFLGADADLDGAVVFEEFAADGRRWFDQLDTDHDGRLGQTELWAYEASLRELGPGPGAGGGPRGSASRPSGGSLGETLGVAPQSRGGSHVRRHEGARGPRGYGTIAEAGFFNLPQPVKAADVNVDQRVTPEEWAAATQRWFTALDTDRDGRLTLATLPKTPLQLRAEARR